MIIYFFLFPVAAPIYDLQFTIYDFDHFIWLIKFAAMIIYFFLFPVAAPIYDLSQCVIEMNAPLLYLRISSSLFHEQF